MVAFLGHLKYVTRRILLFFLSNQHRLNGTETLGINTGRVCKLADKLTINP